MSVIGKLDKLMYSIGVVDKVTGPVNKIMAKINQLSEQAAGAKEQLTSGMMSAAGGAMMLVGSLSPAIDAQAALGEVSSLAVSNESLQQLNNTALNFVSNYGGNAAEVIRSSYDIQSSISGLTGEELSKFTESSAILAKGTKSDAATATNYFGTMYGIYQDTANTVGKNEWVQMLAGQTAASVRMFKTTGSEMSGAFSSLGAAANSHGIRMHESMAVLGQLQATMSGSEAGTKYKAFLAGVGGAQEKLGIQLTNAQGKLLPMVDVMARLKGTFGQIDTVAKSDALKSAFGSDEAVDLIKLLLPQMAQLKGNIETLADIKDMNVAVEMADAMGSAWDRFGGSLNAALTSLGQAVLPFIEPIVDMLATMLKGVVWLTQEFPTLTGIVAAAVVAFVGLTVAMGLLNSIVALYRLAMASSLVLTQAHVVMTKLWQGALIALRVAGFLSLIATMGAATLAISAYNGVMAAARIATLLFSAALWANPITWVVAGVVALIAAVGALIYYWSDFVAAFGDTTWGQAIIAVFENIKAAFDWVISGAKSMLEMLGLIDGKDAVTAEIEQKTKANQTKQLAVGESHEQTEKLTQTAAIPDFTNSADRVNNRALHSTSTFNQSQGQTNLITDIASVITGKQVNSSTGQTLERAMSKTANSEVLNLVERAQADSAVKSSHGVISLITDNSAVITDKQTNLSTGQTLERATAESANSEVLNLVERTHAVSALNQSQGLTNSMTNSLSVITDKQANSSTAQTLERATAAHANNGVLNFVDRSQAVSAVKSSYGLSNLVTDNASVVSDKQANSSTGQTIERATAIHANREVLSLVERAQAVSALNQSHGQSSLVTDNASVVSDKQANSSTGQTIERAMAKSANSEVLNLVERAQVVSGLNQSQGLTNSITDSLSVMGDSSAQSNVIGLKTGLPIDTHAQLSQNLDQVFTNSLEAQEVESKNSYKSSIKRSDFLQNLSNNTNHNSTSTDNSKRVIIDSLTIKSDNVAREFEQLMELAG